MPCDGTLSDLYVLLTAAPGGTTSYDVTIIKNGVATALTANITGASVSGSDNTNTVDFVRGDRICVQFDPTGSFPSASSPGWSVNCVTAGAQPLLTGESSGLSLTATSYLALQAGMGRATEDFDAVIPTDGTISNLLYRTLSNPGAGKSWTVTLVKNGVDTALTATMTGAPQTAEDVTNVITVVAGDRVHWKIVPANTPAGTGIIKIGAVFTPDVAGESIGTVSLVNLTNTNNNAYSPPQAFNSASTSESTRYGVMPSDDYIVTKLRGYLSVAPGGAATRPFVLRKSSAFTALTFTISGANTTGDDTDAGIAYAKGNSITLLIQGTGTPAAAFGAVSCVFYAPPTLDGEVVNVNVGGVAVEKPVYMNVGGVAVQKMRTIHP
jgi:hypothetical protein